MLVKKPESIEELANAIPRTPLSQPSKPEVYFIKYKTQTGGFSAPQPLPIAQPIGLSAPLSDDFSLSGLSGQQSGDILSTADLGSSSISGQTAATLVTSSGSASSIDSTSSRY